MFFSHVCTKKLFWNPKLPWLPLLTYFIVQRYWMQGRRKVWKSWRAIIRVVGKICFPLVEIVHRVNWSAKIWAPVPPATTGLECECELENEINRLLLTLFILRLNFLCRHHNKRSRLLLWEKLRRNSAAVCFSKQNLNNQEWVKERAPFLGR